jgi:hypothetical protein
MAGKKVTFKYQIGTKSIGGFEIDAFLVEKYNFANRVTELPVEEGSNISDHVTEEPDTISIEAFIGQAKFEVYDGRIPDDLSKLNIPDPKARVRQAHHELLRMKREKQPVDIVTGLDTFTNMVITNYSFDRDVETGANLPFSMTFRNIKTVKSEETAINSSLSDSSAKDQATSTANVGSASSEKVVEENSLKERWRQWVKMGNATAEEYQEQWGVPYPQ